MNTEKKEILNQLNQAIKSFGNEHHLSDWERGQLDGLQWAKQIVKDIKTPLASDKFANGA